MTDRSSGFPLLRAALRGAMYASLANLCLYYAWGSAVGPLMVAENPDSTRLVALAPGFVVLSCVVPAIAAGLVYSLRRRVAPRRAEVLFVVAAVLVLVLSMAPLVAVPTDGRATQIGLGLMHIFAGVAIMVPLLRCAAQEMKHG